MSDQQDSDQSGLGRRGALAALLATAAAATAATEGRAAPASNVRKGAGAGLSSPAGSPVTATIASLPVPGYAYRTLWYNDFIPLDPSATARTFVGSGGMYAASVLEAQVEIPAGALFRDVEWYVSNTSGGNATFYAALWTSADGYITLFAPTTVPTGSGLTATRTLTTTADYGPYPQGSKLVLYAPTSATILLNGVRVGFINGGLEYAIRAVPDTVYDTLASGGKFANNETRTIAIAGIDPGTTGVVLRVTAFSSASPGTVKIYPANQAAPTANAIPILASQESVGEVTVMLPSNRSRQIKVAVTRGVHLRLDVVATLR